MAGGALMSKPLFESIQGKSLQAFIDLKHAQGYDYGHQRNLLRQFDRFLCERSWNCAWLGREIVEQYIAQMCHTKAYSQSTMLSPIRDYSAYLHLHYPESYVLKMLPLRAKRPCRFHIYSQAEISVLMEAAGALGPPGSIRPLSVKTLIGLLYVSGLRIGEALALNVADLDPEQRTLFVRKGKFGKDRYVPLCASSVEALLRYRRTAGKISKDQALWVSQKGTRLHATTIGNLFRQLLCECGIASAAPWPRLHDLRHTYAVNCLCKWYEQGDDVNALLPVLSTVMGHVKVSCAQVYLHVPAPLREQAAKRFHQHIETRIIPER
jgi:site-specific recombinase XerD